MRVADFGLAKPIEMEEETPLTQSGMILGTPQYISPELARGEKVDFRSDIYSLGIVLFEMLAGEPSFRGTTPFAIVGQHLHKDLPALRSRRPELTEEAERLVSWMTEKHPGKRPGSYAELRRQLPSVAAKTEARASPTVRTTRSKLVGIAAATLPVLVGAWFGGTALFRSQPAVRPESRLVLAVTPFYGPDEESTKEGRLMAALVERTITQRLGEENAQVLGVEETQQPVRNHTTARELGERLGATAVLWGECFVLRGESEVQPYFTLVPRSPEADTRAARRNMLAVNDPFAALKERATPSTIVAAEAPNQIELRKTSAAGVGNLVLILAGTHALHTEGKPEKALALFETHPANMSALFARLDYAVQVLFAANLGFWMLFVLFIARTRLEVAGLSSISSRERWVLAASLGVFLAAFIPSLNLSGKVAGLSAVPIGMLDSLGSAEGVSELERRVEVTGSDAARYAAAVANHLAGNRSRAQELYKSLLPDPRAQNNLDALNRDELAPVEPLRAEEMILAFTTRSWKEWLLTAFRDMDFLSALLPVNLLLGAAMFLGSRRVAPRPAGARPVPGKFQRMAYCLVPGLFDVRRGAPVRGYVTFTLFAFALVTGLVQFSARSQQPVTGVFTGEGMPNLVRNFVLPTPPDLIDEAAARAYHYWTFFWAYPYAKVFWTAVGLAALASLGLHIARLRSIWSS